MLSWAAWVSREFLLTKAGCCCCGRLLVEVEGFEVVAVAAAAAAPLKELTALLLPLVLLPLLNLAFVALDEAGVGGEEEAIGEG